MLFQFIIENKIKQSNPEIYLREVLDATGWRNSMKAVGNRRIQEKCDANSSIDRKYIVNIHPHHHPTPSATKPHQLFNKEIEYTLQSALVARSLNNETISATTFTSHTPN
jgi:hypothetical protein